MSGNSTPPDDEAVKKLEETLARVDKEIERNKTMLLEGIARLKRRIAATAQQIAEAEERCAQLAAHRDHPEGGYHHRSMTLVVRLHTAFQRMLGIELSYAEQDLATLELGTPGVLAPGDKKVFRKAEDDLDYQESRATMDLNTVLLYWVQNIEGIDAVLRAMCQEKALPGPTPAEEERRAERAKSLRAATKGNRDLTLYLMKLGEDLQETQALIEWAHANVASLATMPPAAKRTALADNDYAKLRGKVIMFATLDQRLTEFPDLAALFEDFQPVVLAAEETVDGDCETPPQAADLLDELVLP